MMNKRALVVCLLSSSLFYFLGSFHGARRPASPLTELMGGKNVSREFRVHGSFCLPPVVERDGEGGGAEELTLATQASVEYLRELILLAQRWDGPIAAALMIRKAEWPSEFWRLVSLARACHEAFAAKVSVQAFYRTDLSCPRWSTLAMEPATCCRSCLDLELEKFGERRRRRTDEEARRYPMNTGRNLAKDLARTDLVLVADIELIPSPDFAKRFLAFHGAWAGRTDVEALRRCVWVAPVFEAEEDIAAAVRSVAQLRAMVAAKRALPFHDKFCRPCHRIPKLQQWLEEAREDVAVHNSGGWHSYMFEPVFVSKRSIVSWDERFTGAGYNKIQQAYELCRADYRFHTLTGVFLVHPGLKARSSKHSNAVVNVNKRRFWTFMRELDAKYGPDENLRCFWNYNSRRAVPPKESYNDTMK